MTAREVIEHFALQPHPEGGWYRRTYESSLSMPTARGERLVGTAILFLLQSGEQSRLHRIQSEEMWHHYSGDAVVVFEKRDEGVAETVVGPDFSRGQTPQHVVPAGVWFGARLAEDAGDGARGWALVGCTCAPGFSFADFELAADDTAP